MQKMDPMIVSAFYYLKYPDDSPIDPTDAATEMYVEVGEEGNDIHHFDHTLRFKVYTLKYLQHQFETPDFALIANSVIVVPTIEDKWMLEFPSNNLKALMVVGSTNESYGQPR